MKEESIKFDPNDIGIPNGNYFALPYTPNEADVLLLSVPWDVTTSYRPGSSVGPEAIIAASVQVDLFDEDIPLAWEAKIGTLAVNEEIARLNDVVRPVAESVIASLEEGKNEDELRKDIDIVNAASCKINSYIYEEAAKCLDQGKIVGIVGGDHSVPFGLIKALGERYDNFGVLHIDAHADLRCAYEGFTYSHASIMFNVLKEVSSVKRLCQVGLRDFSHNEKRLMDSDKRILYFTDRGVARRMFEGDRWCDICDQVVDSLPENIYISFDIDGLASDLSPNTGTPVPGGLTFREADYLLTRIRESGKRLIGFDICEVSPGESEWDANVGARVLFRLALMADKMR